MYARKPNSDMALYGLIGESMIEVGDLVKFKKPVHHPAEKGVWLVVNDRHRANFIVTLKQGNRQKYCSKRRLNKISSCR